MIEQVFFWLCVSFCLLYLIVHGILWKGLNRLQHPKFNDRKHTISVIVAARNEEKNISALLHSLTEQRYPSEMFEIIIADDRSEDSTAQRVKNIQEKYENVRLISIESNTSDMPNKKNALRKAIDNSQFEILAFTDADCIVPQDWLDEVSKHFTDTVGAVAGYSPYTDGFSFLRYEEFKNSLIASAAVEINNAFLCTGRNFAYRKVVYDQVGGFEKIKHSISGDDDLFLQLVQKETTWKIRYMISPESYIRTLPPGSLAQFIHQRIRHVSAGKYYPKKIQIFYALHHVFLLSIVIGIFISPMTALLALMVKWNIDGAFAAKGKSIFREDFTLPRFAANELLFIAYSLLISPLGFLKNFEWKENLSG